jgi:hypothetical protein
MKRGSAAAPRSALPITASDATAIAGKSQRRRMGAPLIACLRGASVAQRLRCRLGRPTFLNLLALIIVFGMELSVRSRRLQEGLIA